jgi:hypothetical protein
VSSSSPWERPGSTGFGVRSSGVGATLPSPSAFRRHIACPTMRLPRNLRTGFCWMRSASSGRSARACLRDRLLDIVNKHTAAPCVVVVADQTRLTPGRAVRRAGGEAGQRDASARTSRPSGPSSAEGWLRIQLAMLLGNNLWTSDVYAGASAGAA